MVVLLFWVNFDLGQVDTGQIGLGQVVKGQVWFGSSCRVSLTGHQPTPGPDLRESILAIMIIMLFTFGQGCT